MRDQRGHVAGVGGHQGEGVHRSTAGGEQLHRPGTERVDDAVDVLGVLPGRALGAAVSPGAATQAAGVVGDDGAVGEVRRECAEAAGVHGMTDQHQRRKPSRRGKGTANVVDESSLGRLEAERVCHGL